MLQSFRSLLRPMLTRTVAGITAQSKLNSEAIESSRLKTHLIKYNLSVEPIDFNLVLAEVKGKYFSHHLMKAAMEKYEKESTPAQIEALCKQFITNLNDFPERRYMNNFVAYYQRQPKELFGWTELQLSENKIALLRIALAMGAPPRKQLREFIDKLDLSKEPISVVILVSAVLSKIGENATELAERVHAYSEEIKQAGEASREQIKVAIDFFEIEEVWELFSRSTFSNFRVFLENHLERLDNEQLFCLMRVLSMMSSQVLQEFKAIIYFIERLAVKTNQTYHLNKTLFILERAKIESKLIVPDMLKNPTKYAKLTNDDIHINNYLVRESRRLGQQFPQGILRPRLEEATNKISQAFLKSPSKFDPNLQITLQRSLSLLLNQRQNLDSGTIRSLQQLNYLHALRAKVLDERSIKMLFLVYCQINDLPNVEILLNHMKQDVPKEFETLVEVWYNIFRLNLKTELPVRITDSEPDGPLLERTISKLFYCLNRENGEKVNQFLKKIQPEMEKELRANNIRNIKTLFNVLQRYSQAPETNKFLFVHLQSNLMHSWSKGYLEMKDITFAKQLFERASAGSRKLHDFLNECMRNPAAIKKHLLDYQKQEKKFTELREKQRVDKIQTRRVQLMQDKKQR